MHKLSTAVPQSSSVLHRLRSATRKRVPLGLLGVLHEYALRGPTRKRVPLAGLVIAALAALRHENLRLIPAN